MLELPINQGSDENLQNLTADIIQSNGETDYFIISSFPKILSIGKNLVELSVSDKIDINSNIRVSCVDAANNSLYIELAKTKGLDNSVTNRYYLSIHVTTDNSVNGVAQIILYGRTTRNKSVKHITPAIVDQYEKNISAVKFIREPNVSIVEKIIPVVDTSLYNVTRTITGSLSGIAVTPRRDTDFKKSYIQNTDYRIISNTPQFDDQLQYKSLTIYPYIVKKKDSYATLDVSGSIYTSSISSVFNSSILKLTSPYFYSDTRNNSYPITDIVNGQFFVEYPYTAYDSGSPNYVYTYSGTSSKQIKRLFAEFTYTDIKTFAGNLSRHKIYRKSNSNLSDYTLLYEGVLDSKELLADSYNCQNQKYKSIGNFYNQFHADKYWFSSSNSFTFTQSHTNLINGLEIFSNNIGSVDGYILAKLNTSDEYRNAVYIPHTSSVYSGSSFDTNFIHLKKNVLYEISYKSILKKSAGTSKSNLQFFITSSDQGALISGDHVIGKGILLHTENLYGNTNEKISYDKQTSLFSVNDDITGTLKIQFDKCIGTLSDISIKPYTTNGRSADTFTVLVPFPLTVANESFDILCELYDNNDVLVFTSTPTVKIFDIHGDSILYPYDPTSLTFVSSSLTVSQSLTVGGDVKINKSLNLGKVPISSSIWYLVYDPLTGDVYRTGSNNTPVTTSNAYHDDRYIYVIYNGLTRKSVAVEYDGTRGRKIVVT